MRWVDLYRTKVVTPADAAKVVKSHDKVYISGNAATAYIVLDALAARKDELEEVEIIHVLLLGSDPLSAPGMEKHFRHRSLFVGPADRQAVNEGRADYIPIFLYVITGIIDNCEII